MSWRARLSLVLMVACWVGTAAGEAPYGRQQFDATYREHWAFQPVVPQAPPVVQDASWPAGPIDAFLLARLEQAGLTPAPAADRATLLRRVYLDLIGLPPTPAEQEAFLADETADAWPRLVDDLLARPQYGERWARHWLDVVRYAESNGYERDNPKPNAWRYRDWVIRAFNDDLPFDRFLTEQISGDEVEGSDAAAQIATTFLRLGPWDDEPADPAVDRYDQLDDVLATTAAAFLAQTIRCARCHDHKYEPFTQRDYARLLAVFEPLKRPQNDRDDLDRLVGVEAELAVYQQATAAADQQAAELQGRIQAIEASICGRVQTAGGSDVPADALDALVTEPDKRSDDQKKLVGEHRQKLDTLIAATATADEAGLLAECRAGMEAVNAARPPEPPRAYIWFEEGKEGPLAHVFRRGDPKQPLEEVGPGLPAILVDAPPPPPTPTSKSTGRRRQLAEWLASPEHPLTARVIVNRIWQHHFGDGLVGTENDFGLMGDSPTHPELLDWLAADFVAGGWRIKRLQRQICLSSAYRMSSRLDEAAAAVDPTNDHLWRFAPRRLEAEAVRDSILAVSGQLNLQAGGPSVYPKIAPAVLAGQSRPGSGWGASDPAQAARRSVYVFVKRTLLVPELELLDQPGTNETCEQRAVSTVAPQALTYLNGEFMQDQSRHFADRLAREAGGDSAARIDLAFRLAFCRPPADAERAAVLEFLAQQEQQILADAVAARAVEDQAPQKALVAFCLVLLNTNEFVYLP